MDEIEKELLEELSRLNYGDTPSQRLDTYLQIMAKVVLEQEEEIKRLSERIGRCVVIPQPGRKE